LVLVASVERLEFFECVRPCPFSTLSAYAEGGWWCPAAVAVGAGESAAMMERPTPCTPSRMPSSTAAFVGSSALSAAAPSEVPGVGCAAALDDADVDAELEAK
jgi:hypothetical protein